MVPEINTYFFSYTSVILAISSHCITQFGTCGRPLEIIHFLPVLENPSIQATYVKIISGTQVCISQLDAFRFKQHAFDFESSLFHSGWSYPGIKFLNNHC